MTDNSENDANDFDSLVKTIRAKNSKFIGRMFRNKKSTAIKMHSPCRKPEIRCWVKLDADALKLYKHLLQYGLKKTV